MAGPPKTYIKAAGSVPGGPSVIFLRQILHARSWTTRRGIHEVPVLSASKKGSGTGIDAMQRQHGCPHGQLHRASRMRRLRFGRLPRPYISFQLQVRAPARPRNGKADHGKP